MVELHKKKLRLDVNDVQLCATSQLALVMGDKAKPRDRVQHEGRVSEIIVTREPYTSSASHTHIQISVQGPSHRPCQMGQLTKGGTQLP